MFSWLAPLISASLVGILKYFIAKLFTQEVAVRIFIDVGWYLADRSDNTLDDDMVNSAAKALGYGFRP